MVEDTNHPVEPLIHIYPQRADLSSTASIIPQFTHTHIETNTESNCSLQKCTFVHPAYYIASHINPCLLQILTPLPSHCKRLFNAHELRNIRLGMTTSGDTAYSCQIMKIDFDYLHPYNFSTQPPSIQEIPECKQYSK